MMVIKLKLEDLERLELILSLENRLDILEENVKNIETLEYKAEIDKIELEVLKEKIERVNKLYSKILNIK